MTPHVFMYLNIYNDPDVVAFFNFNYCTTRTRNELDPTKYFVHYHILTHKLTNKDYANKE